MIVNRNKGVRMTEMTDIESDDLGCFIEPESLEMALEFSKRYTRLLLNRKSVNADIKELKRNLTNRVFQLM